LSRGAGRAIFIEKQRAAVAVIRENLRTLGVEDICEVVHGAAATWLPRFSAGIVFLDPPYDLTREYASALRLLSQAPPPLVVVQHAARFALQDEYGPLRRVRFLKQGDNALSFFEPNTAQASD
jgi:16S rRNA G966 N2-methylase RsmD